MYEEILSRLAHSSFRKNFKLQESDKVYINKKGLVVIQSHAADFISKRVAPENLINDGKQTPMKGHPVFIAQHATACCCRGCINKWHKFSLNGELSLEQQNYLCGLIMEWIKQQLSQGEQHD